MYSNNNKKKQLKDVSSGDVVKLRKVDDNNNNDKIRPKPNLHRFYSFQNHTSSKFSRNFYNNNNKIKSDKFLKNTNDGYVDDVEDNDDDDDDLFLRRKKTFSLQPTSAITVSDLVGFDFKIAVKTKPVYNVEQRKEPQTTGFKNSYPIEDNSINLAYVKLSKRKRLPENYVLSIYDNIEISKITNKNEMESDDSLLNATTSSSNNKILMAKSTSTFSTNSSSNQSSPVLVNKNNIVENSTDSETLLPKIYLNDDEEDERDFIDNKPERRDSGVGRSLTRENTE
jgi:hypothetical protein